MKKVFVIVSALLALAACSSSSSPSSSSSGTPGHGQLTLSVQPNPIMARQVSGDTYDFPFTITLRETGGSAVHINSVSANVTALGGLSIASTNYSDTEIAQRGFPTDVPAHGEISYQFTERKSVPDDRLFSAVSAELRVEGTDASGARTTAQTTVTVRR